MRGFPGTRGLPAIALLLAVAGVSATLPATPAASAVRTVALPPTGAGIDVSYPQCVRSSHDDFPAYVPFAIVGVNGGRASTVNPCFESEYNSAYLLGGTTGLTGTTDQPRAAVYVNTGNPGTAAAWWPNSDETQSGTTVVNLAGACTGLAGAACAYIYGYSMAQADYRRVSRSRVAMPELWWLDVETSNTWQTDVVANSASLSGMVDYFRSKHLDVGLYSTSYQWNRIAGATSVTSDLAGLPSWLAGGSYLGAPADCEKNPLTPNGRVAMVQYVMHLDNDYSCRRFDVASATISPASQSVVGSALTAVSGSWGPSGVSFSYQWSRNGSAIPGATSKTYATTAPDAGTTLTVTITGLEAGYSAASATSNAVSVLAAPTPD